MVMRLYWPKTEAPTVLPVGKGTWQPPGVIPVRKKGKLPHKTYRADYTLEYGQDTLEIHQDGLAKGATVLLVDDLLATGGTMGATIQLIEQCGGRIVELAFLIELTALKGRERLAPHPVISLIQY